MADSQKVPAFAPVSSNSQMAMVMKCVLKSRYSALRPGNMVFYISLKFAFDLNSNSN